MKSSLASKVDRSIRHLRWAKSADGWGGDEEVLLSEVDADLPGRLEWVEGAGDEWLVWVFDPDADVQLLDIFVLTDVDLALTVNRVGRFTSLNGDFHHLEVRCSEAEWTVLQYQSALP